MKRGAAVLLAEEDEHGGCPMELVEAQAEAGVGYGAAPGLADEGSAEDTYRLGRRAVGGGESLRRARLGGPAAMLPWLSLGLAAWAVGEEQLEIGGGFSPLLFEQVFFFF
jgi:hypothetical protein